MSGAFGAFGFLASLGCAGGVGPSARGTDAAGGDGSDRSAGGAGGPSDDIAPPEAPARFTPAKGRLSLLTSNQYRSALADLLGVDTRGIEAPSDIFQHGFSTVGASSLAASAAAVDTFDRSARTLVAGLFADSAQRGRITGCGAAAVPACVDAFIQNFGRRAFRRPLVAAESTRVRAVFDKVTAGVGDGWRGLEFATLAFVTSPKFLYLSEQGEPDPDASDGAFRLTGWEVAARLSFLLTGSTPDDELLLAAERDELSQDQRLGEQTWRLLDSPRAPEALERFFGELYGLPVDRLERDSAHFPLVAQNPQIGASMRDETTRLVKELVFERDADIGALFDADHSFVDPLLARLYEVEDRPAADGRMHWSSADPRGGLLTHAGILAMLSKETATVPTKRGKFVRERILCEGIADPPEDVLMQTLPVDPANPTTQRERLQAHSQNPSCAACHGFLDPIGLVLEQFDAAGAFRTSDNGAVIDPRGELDGVAVANARELGHALREHPGTMSCLVRHLYRHATGHLETEGEEDLVLSLGRHLVDSAEGRLRHAIAALVQSRGFRAVAAP